MSSPSYSQKVMLDGKDTLIAFSVPQSKYLLKEVYRAIMLDSLLKLSDEQLTLSRSIIVADKLAMEKYEEVIENNAGALRIREVQIKEKDKTIRSLNAEVKRQKRQKVIGIICGSVTTVFMGYLWISK
jgi:hypothetical protein